MAPWLSFDTDVKSAPFERQIKVVEDYAAMTSAQRDALEANYANAMLPFGPAAKYLKPGINCAGRPFDHIVSMDWLAIGLEYDLAELVVNRTTAGEKLPVDDEGLAIGLGVIEARLTRGVAAGHFSSFEVTPYGVDTDTRTLQYTGWAVLRSNARRISFTMNLATSAPA
jgi:hypothetical protein